MKYQSSNTKLIHDLTFESGIKKRYKCPECSLNRKKANVKDLEYYPDTNRAYCFHCLTTFFEYKPYVKKEYALPEWKNKTNLTDKSVKWFEGRMISQRTLNEMKVYSDIEYMPQFNKEVEVICFPYFLDSTLVNIKYRGPQKSFKLHSGSQLVLWNINCLKDTDECLICEGEIDALSYVEIGYKNVLSVPNGAGNNLEYLNDFIDLFKPVQTIFISTDNDTKGIELRDEFVRRLGVEKCKLVNLMECKDANEFLCSHSGVELYDAIKEAKQVPVKGIVFADNIYNELVDMFENGIKPGLKIDNTEIDEYCLFETGKLMICTGEPGSGKSEFVDYFVSRLNLLYNWKVGIFSPENYPLKYHYAKLYEKFIGKYFKKFNNTVEFDMAFEHINNNFFYILNEDDLTVDNILTSAKVLVAQKGIKILIIDPYNKIDHQYDRSQTETQYISKFLDKLVTFARFYDVLVILVAHPQKLKSGETANLYSISGSANFYNKADYGWTCIRERNDRNIPINEVQIHWQKRRFKHLGNLGISQLKYNMNNGRFEPKNIDEKRWDNSNWLIDKAKNEYIEVELFDTKNFYEREDEEVPF